MNYHSGYVESCHPTVENVDWYREQAHEAVQEYHYSCFVEFCNALQTGDFIPCGSSGNALFYFTASQNDSTIDNNNTVAVCQQGYYCCCFVFGTSCLNNVLRRRWSCCKQELTCKFQDMIEIKGCCEITRNITK
jgi:hypothetical protein